MAKMTHNTESHTYDLIRHGILNLADLEVNKSGHLSKRQKRILYLNLAFWSILAVFEIIILIPLIYIGTFLQKNLVMGIAEIGLLIMLVTMCVKSAKPYWKDIRDDKPKTASGKVFKHFSVGRGNFNVKGSRVGYCNIRIGNKTFSISPSTYDHIIHEEMYRIYFVPNSRKLINIEPL